MTSDQADPSEILERDDWLNTADAARLLRVAPRTIYHLVASARIPFAKAGGKLLFSRAQLGAWLGATAQGQAMIGARRLPASILGSHDPLLDWAVHQSGCGLTMDCRGSRDGIERFARAQSVAALIHLPNELDAGFNSEALRAHCAHLPIISLHWARRQQGLIVARGNPARINGLASLLSKRPTVVMRQAAAGSNLLFAKLIRQSGGRLSDLAIIEPRACSETELADTIALGHADVGFGIEAVARSRQLDFIPVLAECVELLMWRREAFEIPLQRLLEFTREPKFRRKAAALGGYQLEQCRVVRFNP